MNIPWKTSDTASVALGAQVSPIPNTAYTSTAVDVRGYDWVEFTVTWAGNAGASPSTQLVVTVLYGDAVAGYSTLTVENVGVTGDAPQTDWAPRRSIAAQPAGTWRIPVPVHGASMKLVITADGIPAVTSSLALHSYRRSF